MNENKEKYTESIKGPTFRMGVTFAHPLTGETVQTVESLGIWFYLDQRGSVYAAGPMRPPRLCGDEYEDLTPIFLVGDKWMNWDEIEALAKQAEQPPPDQGAGEVCHYVKDGGSIRRDCDGAHFTIGQVVNHPNFFEPDGRCPYKDCGRPVEIVEEGE